jgi:hypothetical protein
LEVDHLDLLEDIVRRERIDQEEMIVEDVSHGLMHVQVDLL